MNRNDGNITQRRYKFNSSYALSKPILHNGIDGLWREDKPDSSKFTEYDRSSGIRSKIDKITRLLIFIMLFLLKTFLNN